MEWYIPILIFLARICDVSIGTVRTMIIISGHKLIAAVLGFIEVVIWVFAVGGALRYLPEPLAVIGYAGGFAVGTLVGMLIEQRLALGYRVVRVISPKTTEALTASLRARGHRVTLVDGQGEAGPVEIAFMVVRRRAVPRLLTEVREAAPSSYVTVEPVERPLVNGPLSDTGFSVRPWRRLGLLRK